MRDIIILGAGVVGVTTAYFLAKKGHKVTVIDAAYKAGEGTTLANGAQLSYSKTFPLASPKTLKQLPKYLFGKNSPVHFKTMSFGFMRWSFDFLMQCTTKKAWENNDAVLKLALESREAIREIMAEHKIDFDYESKGKFYIYYTDEEVEAAKSYLEHQNKFGLNWHMIDVDEAIKREPALEDLRSKIKGVSFSPLDEAGDASKFTKGLAFICQQMGVEFIWDTKIDEIHEDDGKIKAVTSGSKRFEGRKFVMCMGAHAPLLLKKIGVHIPLYPMKGYSITVPAGNKAPLINITDESKRIVYSKIGNRLRVAGIAEFNDYNDKIHRKTMEGLVRDAKESMPDGGDFSAVTEWTGFRPMTASTQPIIEQNKKFENLYLNTGQGMLGWTLACGSAKRLAGLI